VWPGLVACASTPARTARTGDLPALKSAIEQASAQNGLGSSGLEELAGAVLERELVSLAGPDEAFPDVAPCARQIRPALEDVAEGSSDYAAPAALALIDAGFSAPRVPPDGTSARAIEARLAVGPRAGERRRALMLHGDASVRRAALSAALAGHEHEDIAALAEAARLDPDSEARALAIRALGRIGGEAAVLALVDVYAAASPAERREIVIAWAAPASYAAGGQIELENLAEVMVSSSTESKGTGVLSVLAAVGLLEHAPGSPLGSTALVRAIESSAAETRLLAIEATPWTDVPARAAIAAARKHEDPATRVLALWRFAVMGALDADGTRELEQLASDNATAVGAVARAALAEAGNAGVQPALRTDLAAKQADRRAFAALSLLSLADYSGAARALGDDSPRVRRTVACQVLADPAARRPALSRSATAAPAAPAGALLLLSIQAS
jgi:hypothetical protein